MLYQGCLSAAAEDVPKLNSLTYMNKLSNERWTPEDTELFYKVNSCGT